MSADTWTLKLQLALHTVASASTDTESRLHYAILHKGLEHLQILVSIHWGPKTNPLLVWRDHCMSLVIYSSELNIDLFRTFC